METLRQRVAAVRGRREHIEQVSRAGGASRRLGLTWEKVRPTWERQYKSLGNIRGADAATARHHFCSTRTITGLRTKAGAGKTR